MTFTLCIVLIKHLAFIMWWRRRRNCCGGYPRGRDRRQATQTRSRQSTMHPTLCKCKNELHSL